MILDCLWDTKILIEDDVDGWSVPFNGFHCKVIKHRPGCFIQRHPNGSTSKSFRQDSILEDTFYLPLWEQARLQVLWEMIMGRELEPSTSDLISFSLLLFPLPPCVLQFNLVQPLILESKPPVFACIDSFPYTGQKCAG